jgi:glutaredoxin
LTDETTIEETMADIGGEALPEPPEARPGPGSGPDLLLDGDPTTSGLIAPDPAYPPIVVLGRDTCEDTTRSRDFLNREAIPHVYRNIDLDPDAEALNRSHNGGEIVTPVIVVGDPDAPSAVLVEPSDEELEAAIRAG